MTKKEMIQIIDLMIQAKERVVFETLDTKQNRVINDIFHRAVCDIAYDVFESYFGNNCYPNEMLVGDGYHLISFKTIHEHVINNGLEVWLNDCHITNGKNWYDIKKTKSGKFVKGKKVSEKHVFKK
jgi:hypothetical protein